MPEALLEKPINLLAKADTLRKTANGKLNPEARISFGQYMTPSSVAFFMASLFPAPSNKNIRLLDPGAGVGSLTSAFVELFSKGKARFHIEVDAYEIDTIMRPYLERNLDLCDKTASKYGGSLSWRIFEEDFITEASRKIASFNSLWPEDVDKYTHCIMNPPYKKISSSSRHRAYLRNVGIETVNLYSAFVALSLLLLEKGGYLVAIIPRSFCNGPYYRPFRKFILERAAIRRIHLFDARNKAFREDRVLQENIILALERGGRQQSVAISTSTDDSFTDLTVSNYPFSEIINQDDKELFIHIPTSTETIFFDSNKFNHTLSQLGVDVSTGPVVDFRLKDHLRPMPGLETVPLLYPCHFKNHSVQWPIQGGKKPNAILYNQVTKKWLFQNGFYTVVRRFSSKEEKRRIVASVIDPAAFGKIEMLGLENHLNVFHCNKKPLPETIARGLSVFLNSTAIDEYFRRFSGHTQVNATDLRLMKYPDRKILIALGEWAILQKNLSQSTIDEKMEIVFG